MRKATLFVGLFSFLAMPPSPSSAESVDKQL